MMFSWDYCDHDAHNDDNDVDIKYQVYDLAVGVDW